MFRVLVLCLALTGALGTKPYKWVDVAEKNLQPYIIFGENAEEGKYPYQVSLFIQSGITKLHRCGGSILTQNWILTAAHCCYAGFFNILVGTNSLGTGGQIYRTANFKMHPQYDAQKNLTNDICLVKTSKPIQFSSTIQPVRLPPQNKELKSGDRLNMTGWGITTPIHVIFPDKLQVAKNFKFVPRIKCGALTGVPMHKGYLCTEGGEPGQGICRGDTGGPLVKDGVQYGIASFFFSPCGSGLPDFFTRVSNYVNWIKQVLGPDAYNLQFAQ